MENVVARVCARKPLERKGGYVKVQVTDKFQEQHFELLHSKYASVSSALVEIGSLLFPVAA